jgi:hypothetical protein
MLSRGDLKQAREHLNWVRDHGRAGSIAVDVANATRERLDLPEKSLSQIINEMVR